MMKFHIRNMETFLQNVNACEGAVYLDGPDGYKADLRSDNGLQDMLCKQYEENHQYLPVRITVPNPRDYMKMVMGYVCAY